MRKVWKRISAFLLAMLLTASLGAVALAAENKTEAGPIGIISAMDVELKQLVEEAEIAKQETVAGNTFYTGTLNGVDVVLVKAGIGKVMAASCTQTLINNYRVGGVVFTGIAGGVGDDVNVMDMVIGTGLVQHDYGTETNDGFEWNGNAAADQDTGIIPVDEALSKIAYDSACAVLGAEKVHQGIIATGDQFISSETYVAELQTKFDALACEMEGAAVARVCDQYGVPCAVLRCMSDKADGIAHDTYEFNYTQASNTSASVVIDMMETLAGETGAEPDAEPGALPFTDVTESNWFYDAVSKAYTGNLMGGTSDTAFSPNANTTRGMLATILWRMEGSPEAEGSAAFSDVSADAYYADAVRWAAGKEIVTGNTDGTFAPGKNVTREQMAVILYRYAQSKDSSIANGEYAELEFSDAREVSEYAQEAMRWCASSGIITGSNGQADPSGSATRAQVAAILVRLSETLA